MTTAAFSDDDGDLPEALLNTQGAIHRAADAVNAGLARESLLPAMDTYQFSEGALAQMAESMQSVSRLVDSVSLSHIDTSLAESMQSVSRLVDSVSLSHIDTSLAESMQSVSRLVDSVSLSHIDTSFLDGLFHDTLPWQGLSDQMRDTLAGVVDDARASVEAGENRDVPEEMVAGLEEQAAHFVAPSPGLLPPAIQKQLFAVSVASVLMMTLIYVSVVSDAGNALLDEAYQHAELALIVYLAACTAWDRKQGNRRDGGED
ncbi:hypothetical protein [Streptomyces sp. NPDC057429]|uniref:hypothetical protein n=1 Tax=Streptomyces sp. NPDC057429 TaxID=3346130 RepID=UPI0036B8DB19